MFYTAYESPLGEISLFSRGDALCGLYFNPQKYGKLCEGAIKKDDLAVFSGAKRWLDTYFGGKDPGFVPPLDIIGTAFQRRVCELMLEIPFGALSTYKALADAVASETGRPMSAQAVGQAVGHNPISLIIPCHRVVGTGGSLTGYGGGMERKVRLLQNEGVDFIKNGLFVPTKGTAL